MGNLTQVELFMVKFKWKNRGDDIEMKTFKMAMLDQHHNLIMKEVEGDIYKNIGINGSLSAGKIAYFSVHLDSGRIIPRLVDFDKNVVKNRIDRVQPYLNNDMTYDQVCGVVEEIINDEEYFSE